MPEEVDRNELLIRSRRQVVLHQKNLQQLGVTIHEVEAGIKFNPEHHHPMEYKEVSDPEKQGTVFSCDSPLFLWKDEWNQEQVIPAQVVLFAEKSDRPAEGDGKPTSATAVLG